MPTPFTPDLLPNLEFWFEPSKGGMTQDFGGAAGAATVGAAPASANNDLIGFLPDLSGNNYHGVASTTQRPAVETNAFGTLSGAKFTVANLNNLNLGAPAGLEAMQYKSCTAYFVFKEVTGASSYGAILSKTAAAGGRMLFATYGVAPVVGRQFCRYDSAFPNYNRVALPTPPGAAMVRYRFSLYAANASGGSNMTLGREEIFYNGVKVMDHTQVLTNAAWPTANNWRIGSIDTLAFLFGGTIGAILMYGRAQTDAEGEQVEAYLAKYGVSAGRQVPAAPRAGSNTDVFFTGNSLIYGLNGFGRDVPTVVGETLLSLPLTITSQGIGGISTSTMITAFSVRDQTMIRAGNNTHVYVWELTNDLSSNANATTTYNNMVTFCNLLRAAGAKTITVLGCLPRGSSSTFETNRQALATRMLLDTPTAVSGLSRTYAATPGAGAAWDYYIDLGADPTIGAAGSQNNTTYYGVDLTHLTPAGYAVVAPYVSAHLAYVYSLSPSAISLTTADTAKVGGAILADNTKRIVVDGTGKVGVNNQLTPVAASDIAAAVLAASADGTLSVEDVLALVNSATLGNYTRTVTGLTQTVTYHRADGTAIATTTTVLDSLGNPQTRTVTRSL